MVDLYNDINKVEIFPPFGGIVLDHFHPESDPEKI
jgi:hypothetical protein